MAHRQFPAVAGFSQTSFNPHAHAGFINCVNESGGNLTAGDVVIIKATAADLTAGKALPVTFTSGPDSPLVLGVVGPNESTIPDKAPVLVQVVGLHPGVSVNNNNGALTEGTYLSTGGAPRVAQGSGAGSMFGVYADADYDSSGAKKAVFLTNPLGIKPSG